MSVDEFLERLDTMDREGLDRDIIAFAEKHASDIVPRLTREDHMWVSGIVESAGMTLDLNEHASYPPETDSVTGMDTPPLSED